MLGFEILGEGNVVLESGHSFCLTPQLSNFTVSHT